jgi:linear amide C-N hydrolase (choloylglycine hydrolase family)
MAVVRRSGGHLQRHFFVKRHVSTRPPGVETDVPAVAPAVPRHRLDERRQADLSFLIALREAEHHRHAARPLLRARGKGPCRDGATDQCDEVAPPQCRPPLDQVRHRSGCYVNLSMTNVPPVQLGPVKLEPFGQGSGMLGLPGDFTPPSRFVRAAAFSQSVFPSKTGHDAILEAFHILNQFDIPKGAARERQKDEHGNILADYTTWTAASDLKAKQFYFRTYDNSEIRMVDLMKMNIGGKDIVKMSIEGDEAIEPLTQ